MEESDEMENDRLNARLRFWKYTITLLLGTVLSTVLTFIINHREVRIKELDSESQIRIKEQENLSNYFEYTMEGDVYDRLKLAYFFSTVLEDDSSRVRWNKYLEIVEGQLNEFYRADAELKALGDKKSMSDDEYASYLSLTETKERIGKLLNPVDISGLIKERVNDIEDTENNLLYFTGNRIKRALRQKGYQYFTDQNKLNLVAIRKDTRKVNDFDDALYVLYTDGSGALVQKSFVVTTDPGLYFLVNSWNSSGTAIMAESQYVNKFGLRLFKGRYTALAQKGPIKIFRDNNQDELLDFVNSEEGIYGLAIHRASSKAKSVVVNKWSAGSIVFADPVEYSEFIQLCESVVDFNKEGFTLTLLNELDLSSPSSGEFD